MLLSPSALWAAFVGSRPTQSCQESSEFCLRGDASSPWKPSIPAPHPLTPHLTSHLHDLHLFSLSFALLAFSLWVAIHPFTGNCTVCCQIFRIKLETKRLCYILWAKVMLWSEGERQGREGPKWVRNGYCVLLTNMAAKDFIKVVLILYWGFIVCSFDMWHLVQWLYGKFSNLSSYKRV